MTDWRDIIPPRDLEALRAGGYGGSIGLGSRPCLLAVDVTYGFTGRRELSESENAIRYPRNCGERAWESIKSIAALVHACRESDLPIIYTTNAGRHGDVKAGLWVKKLRSESVADDADDIVDELSTIEPALVLRKTKPSAFFATPLVAWLHELRTDSLVVVGGTTSGCVRATVIDAFSYNYPTTVVEDAVFDRSEISHGVNLFDMSMKYAEIAPSASLIKAIRQPARSQEHDIGASFDDVEGAEMGDDVPGNDRY